MFTISWISTEYLLMLLNTLILLSWLSKIDLVCKLVVSPLKIKMNSQENMDTKCWNCFTSSRDKLYKSKLLIILVISILFSVKQHCIVVYIHCTECFDWFSFVTVSVIRCRFLYFWVFWWVISVVNLFFYSLETSVLI